MDNSLDIITVFNADSEPYDIRYDGKSYGVISPGKARRMPRFLAKLNVKHLIDQCINHYDEGDTGNSDLRDKWATKVVLEEEVYIEPVKVSAEDRIRKDMDQMNAGADLDRILKKHKDVDEPSKSTAANFTPGQAPERVETPATPTGTPEEQPATPAVEDVKPKESRVIADLGIAAPAGDSKVLKEVDNTDDPNAKPAEEKPATEQVPPTRKELYSYAEHTLGMKMDDPKTMEKLEEMNIKELIESLGYEPPIQ